jgi:hypothetical protein
VHRRSFRLPTLFDTIDETTADPPRRPTAED